MNTETEKLTPVQLSRVENEETTSPSEGPAARKNFVEPAISFPVDVLEATTFFQLTDSGSTT